MAKSQIENAIDLMHAEVRFPPAIVGWNRLEGRPRTAQFDRALRAEVRDALWFLTRQWQFGEFKGEDAGSPVEVRTAVRVDPLQHYAVHGQGAIAYDPEVALEAHVEREKVAFDLVIHSQVTRTFWRLIDAVVKTQPTIKAMYLAGYPLLAVAGVADPDGEHALQIGLTRTLDAGKLLDETVGTAHDARVDGFALPAADKALLKQAGRDLRAWFFAQFSQPSSDLGDSSDPSASGDMAWNARFLEYQFAVATDTADRGQTVLLADQYANGHLDWFAFDVDAAPAAALNRKDGSAAVPTPANVTPLSFIPAPVSFGGMPSHRYWEMESRQIEFADIDAHT
ncbi:MAG: hypothetical protein ABJC13_18130, partial [Acidobacteriota bacterium]